MKQKYNSHIDIQKKERLLSLRRNLRRNMTVPERVLWKYLKADQLGVSVRRQHSIQSYILDFYIPKLHLAIEIDGETHGKNKQEKYDKKRTAELKKGFDITIIRFTNTDIMTNLSGVLETIQMTIKKVNLPLTPSFKGGRTVNQSRNIVSSLQNSSG